MKADLIVSDPVGAQIISAVRHLPRPLQRLSIQLLSKATRAASFNSLTFNWLIKLIKSQVFDLIQVGLNVWMQRTDPTLNSKFS